MTFQHMLAFLEEIAPFKLQEKYDNAGLIIGHPSTSISNVLISLDATPAVVQEAIDRNCNLIVSHHPIIFEGLKKINGHNYIEQTVIQAIKHNIGLIAIHTNLDNVFSNGVNERIAQQLDLHRLTILAPKLEADPQGQIGAGLIGTLEKALSEHEFLNYLKEKMELDVIRHTKLLDKPVQKVAVCGGSGSFLLEHAMRKEADVFVSADFKYHQFFDANDQIIITDIGHYESEKFTIPLLQELINQKFSNFAAHLTQVNTNPIKYH